MQRAKGSKPDANWKEHPVIIAVLSGAAAVTFMATVVFPMLTGVQQQEIRNLKKDNERLSLEKYAINKKLSTASLSLSSASNSLSAVGTELRMLRLGSTFDGPNGLPYGWRKVNFGSKPEDILREYADLKPVRKERWIDITGNGMPFGEATFYISEKEGFRYLLLSNYYYTKQRLPGSGLAIDKLNNSSAIVKLKLADSFGVSDLKKGETSCWLGRKGVDIVSDTTSTMFFPASRYELKECGSEEEVAMARLKALNCPIPRLAETLLPQKSA